MIALLGDQSYASYLIAQLRDIDMVPANRAWAVAALSKVSSNFRQDLDVVGEDWTLAYQLSSAMYRNSSHVSSAIISASGVDDPLAHKWLSVLYGERRADIPVELIRELTASSHSDVSEYAIWGLHRNRNGSIKQVMSGPQDVDDKPSNVRRWYYRLLLGDATNRVRFKALIEDWIEHEEDSKAREGLALGLGSLNFDPYWNGILFEWRRSEQDTYVNLALDRYFQKVNYKLSGGGIWLPTVEPFASQSGLQLVKSDNFRPKRGVVELREEPGFRIDSSRTVPTYTLVVDIERFSLATDDAQIGMFEQMLGVLRRRRDLADASCLLVGDGAIVIWTDPASALAPYDVATELYRSWADLSKPRVRIGMHSGVAHQLRLNDGRLQFIGDAINKAVRCCSVADPGVATASEEYFQTIIKPRIGTVGADKWESKEVEIKHGEVIRVRVISLVESDG
ncbi:hypothetical protein [Amycolatopsis tolypomycina]|uniref:hypothetical protein n=1 Tax=Amycolatopsis tolypomycina TaxID=208445 RepID=UPI0033A8BA1D